LNDWLSFYEAETANLGDEEDVAAYLQADLAAVEHVKKGHPKVKFPLKGKMNKITLGQFFVFDASMYLHGGGPGKNSQLTDCLPD
jgi:hypothetical protein